MDRVGVTAYVWGADKPLKCSIIADSIQFSTENIELFVQLKDETFQKMIKAYADAKIKEAQDVQKQRSVGGGEVVSSTESSQGKGVAIDPRDIDRELGSIVRACENGRDLDKRCAT
jgi:hypothetical protein